MKWFKKKAKYKITKEAKYYHLYKRIGYTWVFDCLDSDPSRLELKIKPESVRYYDAKGEEIKA